MFREEFVNLDNWSLYRSAGHDGQGLRRPSQIAVANGIATIYGDSAGKTGGMKLRSPVQKHGLWSVHMRTPPGAGVYHPVCLLWGVGSGSDVNAATGEIDFVEFWNRPARDRNEFTLHYGDGSQMIGGGVAVDGTQWHTYHVLWTPSEIKAWIDNNSPYYRTTDTAKFPQSSVETCIQLDFFPFEDTTGGSASMQVDSVVIWTLAEYEAIVPPPVTETEQTWIFGFASHHRLWAGSTLGDTGDATGLPLERYYVLLRGTAASTAATKRTRELIGNTAKNH